VFLITAAVAVWSAFDRESAWSKFWLIIGAALLYYSFANWAAGSKGAALERQAWMLAALGAMVAGYLLLTHDWEAYPSKFDLLTKVGNGLRSIIPAMPAERFHPNVLAGAMAILIPFSAGVTTLSWFNRNSIRMIIGSGLLLLTIFGLIMSGARGAWAAVGLAVVVVLLWSMIRFFVQSRRRRRSWFFGSIAVLLLVMTLLLIAAPSFSDSILSSLPSLESGVQRADLYRNSLILINDYPFIGAGLSNFMMLYSTYALLLHVGFTTHGHNLFLDLSIEQGLLAGFVFLWMTLLMGEAAWRSMVRRRKRNMKMDGTPVASATRPSHQSVLIASASLSIVVLFLHGLVDDAIYSSRMVILMFVPFAFGVPALVQARTPSRRQQLRAIIAAAAILVLIMVFSWRPILSLLNSNLAAVSQGQAELSVYEWPEWDVQDEVRREVDLEAAVAGYRRALSLNPGNASAQRRLGQIMLSLGEYDEALRHLEAAYTRTAWNDATGQLLGEAYLVNGRIEEGAALWSQTNNDQGQLDLRSAWYSEIDASDRFEVIKSIALIYQ
jgi:O-antigen ligase